MPSGTNVLEYWKQYENRFPILVIMARDFLAVPISGVGVERLFNTS
jgi:hypothetical protein